MERNTNILYCISDLEIEQNLYVLYIIFLIQLMLYCFLVYNFSYNLKKRNIYFQD